LVRRERLRKREGETFVEFISPLTRQHDEVGVDNESELLWPFNSGALKKNGNGVQVIRKRPKPKPCAFKRDRPTASRRIKYNRMRYASAC
jgi:hypothetical protein